MLTERHLRSGLMTLHAAYWGEDLDGELVELHIESAANDDETALTGGLWLSHLDGDGIEISRATVAQLVADLQAWLAGQGAT